MLSYQTKTLWAKKPRNNADEQWLPLSVHMSDAAETARLLWYHWVPSCTKRIISYGLQMVCEGNYNLEDLALSCFVFLAAAHDVGKAIPAFQGKLWGTVFDEQLRKQITDAGLPLMDNIHPHVTRHYWASQLILERCGFPRKIAVVLGGHHGQPPCTQNLHDLRKGYKNDLGWGEGQEAWDRTQRELLVYALGLAGVSEQEAQSWQPDITAQVLLSGLVIMVDWIVSNKTYFPHISLFENAGHSAEALERWRSLWELKRFPIEPIKTRLCHYEERFFLFHPERPFYQVAGLDKGTNYTAAKLLGDLSESGNKVRLFPVRTGNEKHSISYAEAARWLLYLNSFDDTSNKPSVRGKNMPSPGAGWLGKLGLIYAVGTNLFETLMLNFVLTNNNGEPWSNGNATWEISEPRTKEREEIVLPQDQLTILTLQSRRLLLQREGSRVVGYRLMGGEFFPKENATTEQMTLWRKDAKKDVYLPKRHDPSKQLWRDFPSFIADGNDLKKPGIVRWLSILKDQNCISSMVTFQIASVKYGDKDFFVTDVFEDSLSINTNMLSKLGEVCVIQITRLLSLTEDCVKQLFFLAADLAKANGDSNSTQHKAGEGISNAAKAEAYFRLDMPFRRWLANVDPTQSNMDEAEQAWKNTVKQVLLQLGEEMAHQFGEKAITGRWVKGKNDSKEKLYTAPAALLTFKSKIKRIIEEGG